MRAHPDIDVSVRVAAAAWAGIPALVKEVDAFVNETNLPTAIVLFVTTIIAICVAN
jgi:hypothetical protein